MADKINLLRENPDKPPLRPDQIEDLAFYMQRERCANLSDPGTGKTPSVCAYLQYLWEYKGVKSAWAMPGSLLAKNRLELLRFTDLGEDDITIIDGSAKARARQMREPSKVFLMGFRRFADDWSTFKGIHPDMDALSVDEVHMGFAGHDSKRTQDLYQAMKRFTYFLPMTGSLIDGKLDSAYPTIHIIEPRYYESHFAFLNYHGVLNISGERVGWENHAKLGRIFQRHAVRRSFESIFGKESKVIQKVLCPMSTKQRAAYDEFESSAILELEDSFLDASGLPGVHAIRCRQIMAHPETFGLAAGELTGKDARLIIDLTDHKNTGKPFIIYAALVPEQQRIQRLCEKMGFKVGMINGTISPRKRGLVDEQFTGGALDGIIGSPETSSVGFNWGHVDHIICASLDYKNTNFVQAYRRGIRGKRKTPLRISVYEYERSIDQRIFQIVDIKSKDSHKIDETYEQLNLSGRKTKKGKRKTSNKTTDFSLSGF